MKIKSLLLIFILLIPIGYISAQDTAKTAKHLHKVKKVVMPKYPRQGYVALVGGLGLPLGAFASDLGTATGYNLSISAAFPGIIAHGGIAFKFDHGVNGFNQSRLQGIENNIASFGNINCTFPDGLGHCNYSAFLTGLYLTYPHKHITIDLRMLVGAMMANIPALTITYNDITRDNSANFYQAPTSAGAFAFDLGFELKYPLKPRICILLSADYLHAVPSFLMVTNGATLTSYGSIVPATAAGQEITESHPFNLFNLSIGVGYTIVARK